MPHQQHTFLEQQEQCASDNRQQSAHTRHMQPQSHLSHYTPVQGDIPCDIPLGSWLSIERTRSLNVYTLGFQPARSIPEIPRWFCNTYLAQHAPHATIADPFAGSGTTILEGVRSGASVYWFDYHPLSRLICQIKTTTVSLTDVQQETTRLLTAARCQHTAPVTVTFTNKDFWFQQPVQDALEILRAGIVQAMPSVQPVLWLAFASTVRKSSNMQDGMILAARRKHIQDIPVYTRSDVYSFFQAAVQKSIHALAEWQEIRKYTQATTQELPIHDARDLSSHRAGDWDCDAIVTSPPYINAIDYVWASKFELHWLGLVASNSDRLALYEQEIGTERFPKAIYQELGRTGHPDLDRLIHEVYTGTWYQATKGQNQLRARVVYQYFTDMHRHFQSSFARLRPGGYYCFAIGDQSRICGVDIPVATLLTDIAQSAGFQPAFHFHILLKRRQLNIPRNVTWAGTIKHDTVVVLRKPLR